MKRFNSLMCILIFCCACEVKQTSTPKESIHPTANGNLSETVTSQPQKTTAPEMKESITDTNKIENSLNFTRSPQEIGFANSWDVEFGDVDGDGDLDAFVANSVQGSAGNTLWLNDGSGSFSPIDQDLGYGQSISLGDLDDDGDLDALVTNWWGGEISTLWINDGSGIFKDTDQNFGFAFNSALGDLDGDGDLDAFLARMEANSVWLNDGSGTFMDTGQLLGEAITASVGLADVDGDGDLDAVSAGWEEPALVWLNDGTGNFTVHDKSLSSAQVHVHDLALGDLDGDGDVDVFMVTASGDPNQVWLNEGDGTYKNTRQALHSSLCHGISLGDLDRDGDLDAATAHGDRGGSSGGRIWINDGKGQFTQSDFTLGELYSTATALGDMDRDGDLDILLAHGETWHESGGDLANEVWIRESE